MLCKILKTFPYSTDGVNARQLQAEAIEEIDARFAGGLIAEQYCEAAPDGAAPTISDDDLLDAATDDELRVIVKTKTGRAPHPNTSRDKLLAAARA